MRQSILGNLFLLLAISFVLAMANVGAYGTEECDYSPSCTEYAPKGTLDCSACEARKYNTACTGGCNYSSYSTTCFPVGSCNYPDIRTTTAGCIAGYIRNQICSSNTCDWVNVGNCYLDPEGDADTDGIPNSADDCPTQYAPSPTHCNGCPNPVCDGCLTWPTACPATGARLCTNPDNQQCIGTSCSAPHCDGNNWCTYNGDPYCDGSTGNCVCPQATCTYSTQCDEDDDNDGVPDPNDQCPGTASGAAVDFNGCSCAQKTCNDNKECTTDTCSAGQCIFTNKPLGTACTGGECDGQGTCVATAPCTATPGCRATQPLGSHATTGTCTTGTCWQCNDGTTWNPTTSTCQASTCTPSCAGQSCGASNGCGGFCAVESCPSGESCEPSGSGYACLPITCTPSCAGKLCGASDGCSGFCDVESCPSGQSCEPAGTGFACSAVCTPECPDPATVACGQALGSDGCNSVCAGTGTACTAGFCLNSACVACRDSTDCAYDEVCTGNACVPAGVTLVPTPGNVGVVAGNAFTVKFSLSPDSSTAKLRVTGWPHGGVLDQELRQFTFIPAATDVGSHTLNLEVFHQSSGEVLGAASVPIDVQCDPDDAVYGPCCVQGRYATDEQACAPDNAGDDETWWCQAGQCAQHCVQDYQHPLLRCRDGAVWEYDTCNKPFSLAEDCAGQVCTEDGGAHCADPPETCTRQYAYECRGQDGVRVDDGCGLVETIATCSAEQECVSDEGNAWCRALGACHAYPGTIHCDGRCISPLTSRTDCGACGRACSRNEQCVQGSCEQIPGCTVICDTNQDCGAGYVCVQAGSCTDSECQPVTALAQAPGMVEGLAQRLTDGLVQIEHQLEGTTYAFVARNLGPEPVHNVTLLVEVNKLVTSSAASLAVSGVAYEVVEDDPVLRFTIPELDETQAWRMTVTGRDMLGEEYASMVTVRAIDYDEPALLAAWNATKDALAIGINSEYDGQATKFHLSLTPNKGLAGVSIPIEIPKCMASYANEMNLDGDYHIVEDDPLIVWQFDQLEKPTQITFSVPKDVDEECKAQLKAMALARRIGKPLNPWLSLLLIPIIGAILIFFQRFGPGDGEHRTLTKAEYYRFGREKERMSEEELDRGWRDYKRRFR